MAQGTISTYVFTGGTSINLFNGAKNIYVPLDFGFRQSWVSLPLIALQYHEVKIIVDAKTPYTAGGSGITKTVIHNYGLIILS